MKIRSYKPGSERDIALALHRLADARHLLASAGATRAYAKVLAAISSAKGARRHAERVRDRAIGAAP